MTDIHDLYQTQKGYEKLTRWYDSLVGSFSFPFKSKYLSTRFGETHYLDAGDPNALPLLLVQAIAGSAPLWYHQIGALAEHFHVLAFDTPGQPGRSAPNPPSLINNGYTEWLLDVVNSLQIEDCCLAGVSSGGWHVMQFALHHPDRVKKIILLSPTGLANARFPINIFFKNVLSKKKDQQTLEDELSTRSFLPESESAEFDRNLARAMVLATRHFRLGKSLHLYDPHKGRIKPFHTLKVLRKLFFSEPLSVLKSLETPGIVILGEHEMLFSSHKVARKVNRKIPALNAVVLEGTGHSAMYDQPQKVNRLIIDFLKPD